MFEIEYTWCERKRELNLSKHKVDFANMHSFNWVLASIIPDDEFGDRFIATSYIDSSICVAVYTEEENGKIHVISLRKATNEEIRRYAET